MIKLINLCHLRDIEIQEDTIDFQFKNFALTRGTEKLNPDHFSVFLLKHAGEMSLKHFLNSF